MAAELPCRQPQRRAARRGELPRVATLLLVVAAFLCIPRRSELRGQASAPAFLSRSSRSKVLFSYKDHQIVFQPRAKGKLLPRLKLQKIPPKPLSLAGLSTSVEGNADKDLLGFPFTTSNAGSLKIGFPRWSGALELSTQEAPANVEGEDSQAQRIAAASYEQSTPGLGDIKATVNSRGEWNAGLSRQIEDLGTLRGSINSQLDWSADLSSTYPEMYGFVPSITYGATQDGMQVRTTLEGLLHPRLHGSYSVQNAAGQYSPADLTHDGKLTLSSKKGGHVLEAQGTYDRKLQGFPASGSLTYKARVKPVTFEASVDNARYRLQARAPLGQISAAVGRKVEESGRPAELQLRIGKVAATALTDGQTPRARFEVAI